MRHGHHASVSPDGLLLAYSTCEFKTESLEEGYNPYHYYNYEIAVVGIDGGSPERLTENARYDHYPQWSPDGTRIAFIAGADEDDTSENDLRLFTMAPDGSNVFKVSDEEAALYPPVWSPDGRRLAFAAVDHVVYTVRPDGSELNRVRVVGKSGILPSWSPDSEELAFASVEGVKLTVYIAKADGTALRQVWMRDFGDDHRSLRIGRISWSPDGAELLLVPGLSAWVVQVDGSGGLQLDLPMKVDAAAWSSDGSKIAARGYARYESFGELRIMSMAREGHDLRILVGAELVPNPIAPYPNFPSEIEQLYSWNSPSSRADIDLTACSAGVVIPDPKENPGLVEDCRTLLGLRDTLAGRAELGWDTVTPIAEWEGVSLSGSPLRVDGVYLPYLPWRNLTGVVPSELGNLTELRELVLSSNPLTGEIPGELGRLALLDRLYLDDTYLSGNVPSELGQLANLGLLRLNSTYVDGTIPLEIYALRSLWHLDLSNTNVSGPIPPDIGALISLGHLDLSNTNVSGLIPPDIGALISLGHLDLSNTNVSGPIPPEIGALGRLEELDLSNTNLSGTIPLEIGSIGSLRKLDLSNTNLIGFIPPEIGALGRLEELDLSNTNLIGPIPPEIGALGRLKELDLSNTNLSGRVPPEIAGLGSLYSLDVSYTGLCGSVPLGFRLSLSNFGREGSGVTVSPPSREGEPCDPPGETSQ